MRMMLSVMRECRNFFEISEERGEFSVESGIIRLNETYRTESYILITGSALNGGLYKISDDLYTLDSAVDELSFTGIVYGLSIPKDFLNLCEKIKDFSLTNEGRASGIISESVLGVHSYTLAVGKDGIKAGWRSVFAADLAPFRKMFTHVRI